MIRFGEKYFAIGIGDVYLGLRDVSEQYTESVIHRLRLTEQSEEAPVLPRVMVSSAMEVLLGIFGFYTTTLAEKNVNNMRPCSLRFAAFHACSSSRSDRNSCRLHMHKINHV